MLTVDSVVEMLAHQNQDLDHQQALSGFSNSLAVTADFILQL